MNTGIENSICEAIELIVNKSVKEAKYDRTIQATIARVVDESIGKYQVSYQGALLYAFAQDTEKAYSVGTSVYVLIPGNDMSADKTIIGSATKLGIGYVTKLEGDDAYDYIGNNIIIDNNKNYSLSSYRYNENTGERSYVLTVYDYNRGIKDIDIDVESANLYLKESPSIVVGGMFKTSLPKEQQRDGNYGIIYGLTFADESTGKEVTKYYTVDVNTMVGNPYQLTNGLRQVAVFDIDNENFVRVDSINIFTSNFPNKKTYDKIVADNSFDIEISLLELSGAKQMSQEELNSVGISLYTPNGSFFTAEASSADTLPIVATVKVRGKAIDLSSQKIPFYWFKEDLSVTNSSELYNRYGGIGWRALNSYKVIEEASENSIRQVEWIPLTETCNVTYQESKSKRNRYKCVAIYDGVAYSKTITILNLGGFEVSIVSDSGDQFYFDIGQPTLTCLVNGKEELGYKYAWGVERTRQGLTILPVDQVENESDRASYFTALEELEQLQSDIENGIKFPNSEAQRLDILKDNLKQASLNEFINNNKFYNVEINKIDGFATYKCSVFDELDNYIGTAEIKLTNSMQVEGGYTLYIKNGKQTFKYDEYGVSPASRSLENPMILEPLEIGLIDNLGNELSEEILREADIEWRVPTEDRSMLQVTDSDQPAAADFSTIHGVDYYIYKDSLALVYEINNAYYYNKKVNDIELVVNYKGTILSTKTDFTFVKEGLEGTNGTRYTAKITRNSSAEHYPTTVFTFVKGTTAGYLRTKRLDGYTSDTYIGSTKTSTSPFKVELYKGSEKIFEGSTSGTAIDNNTQEPYPVSLEWSMLTNKYPLGVSDKSDFEIDKYTGGFAFTGNGGDTPANIVKCAITYGSKASSLGNKFTIYATLPIVKVEVENSNYDIGIKEYTGFNRAYYSSDGSHPKYDSSLPFEIEVKKRINDTFETVSGGIKGDEAINSFNWSTVGDKYNYNTGSLENSNDILLLDTDYYNEGLKSNQKWFKPTTTYDGVSVNNAIVVSNVSVGSIHYPIHLMLNKYGMANLNGWDGNTIEVDNNGGYIHSPQVGAGKKEADNTFTGMLVGEVQEANKTHSETGLFAYYKGQRTVNIDAESGSASFGYGSGKITIDPSSGKSMLYSSSFWRDYNNRGFPSSYVYHINTIDGSVTGNTNKSGMLIDLNRPSIVFGNGNFSVDNTGKLRAKDAIISGNVSASTGKIGNWTISDDGGLFTGSKNSFNSSYAGIYLGQDGIKLGNNFSVDNTGKLIANSGTFKGSLEGATGSFSGRITTSELIINGSNVATWLRNNTAKIDTLFTALIKYGYKEETGANSPVTSYDSVNMVPLGDYKVTGMYMNSQTKDCIITTPRRSYSIKTNASSPSGGSAGGGIGSQLPGYQSSTQEANVYNLYVESGQYLIIYAKSFISGRYYNNAYYVPISPSPQAPGF